MYATSGGAPKCFLIVPPGVVELDIVDDQFQLLQLPDVQPDYLVCPQQFGDYGQIHFSRSPGSLNSQPDRCLCRFNRVGRVLAGLEPVGRSSVNGCLN